MELEFSWQGETETKTKPTLDDTVIRVGSLVMVPDKVIGVVKKINFRSQHLTLLGHSEQLTFQQVMPADLNDLHRWGTADFVLSSAELNEVVKNAWHKYAVHYGVIDKEKTLLEESWVQLEPLWPTRPIWQKLKDTAGAYKHNLICLYDLGDFHLKVEKSYKRRIPELPSAPSTFTVTHFHISKTELWNQFRDLNVNQYRSCMLERSAIKYF